MEDFGAAILDSLKQMYARFDRIDGRLGSIDGRLEGIDGRLDRIDGRLDGIDGRLDRLEARQDRLESRQERIEERQDRLEALQERTEADLAHLRAAFDALPDFHLMMVRGAATLKKLHGMEHALVDVRTRLAEVYGAMATDSEINIFRNELESYREAALENEIRLGTLEAHVLKRPMSESVD